MDSLCFTPSIRYNATFTFVTFEMNLGCQKITFERKFGLNKSTTYSKEQTNKAKAHCGATAGLGVSFILDLCLGEEQPKVCPQLRNLNRADPVRMVV